MNKKLRIKKEIAESQKEFDERKPSRDTCPEPSCKQYFGNSTLMMEAHRNRYPEHFKTVQAIVEVEEALTEFMKNHPAKED